MTEPTIGWWYAPCCIQDLEKIETQEELRHILDNIEEDGGRLWPTLEEALAELEQDGWDSGERARAEGLRLQERIERERRS